MLTYFMDPSTLSIRTKQNKDLRKLDYFLNVARKTVVS